MPLESVKNAVLVIRVIAKGNLTLHYTNLVAGRYLCVRAGSVPGVPSVLTGANLRILFIRPAKREQ